MIGSAQLALQRALKSGKFDVVALGPGFESDARRACARQRADEYAPDRAHGRTDRSMKRFALLAALLLLPFTAFARTVMVADIVRGERSYGRGSADRS